MSNSGALPAPYARGNVFDGGARAVRESPCVWLEKRVRDAVHADGHAYSVADLIGTEMVSVGLVEAQSVSADPVFEPMRVLHISAVHVPCPQRGRGIGRTLIKAALDWGPDSGCTQTELKVLTENPARSLYEALGFRPFETEMTRNL